VSQKSPTKKKMVDLHRIMTKWADFSSDGREMFQVSIHTSLVYECAWNLASSTSIRNLPFFPNTSISNEPQTNRKSPKTYWQILFCRTFYADHFGEKNFFLSSRNDGTRFKMRVRVRVTVVWMLVRTEPIPRFTPSPSPE
jgi:hypothetical protein